MNDKLERISDHLYRLADICNVYLIVADGRGLLVDTGSGRILDSLSQLGGLEVEVVLHTHHHRDQCMGTPRVRDQGARMIVPEYERHLFDRAELFWQSRRTFDNYNDRNTFFSIGEDIPVDSVLEDYEIFKWRGYEFFVLPAKGHTFGAVALISRIDGRRVAFTGDLCTVGGRLYQLHAKEYTYASYGGDSLHIAIDSGTAKEKGRSLSSFARRSDHRRLRRPRQARKPSDEMRQPGQGNARLRP